MFDHAQSDLFVSGGRIYDAGGLTHESILIRNGRVAGFDVPQPVGTSSLDLAGATVLGGFCDSHIHLFAMIDRFAGLDCSSFIDRDSLLAAIAAFPGTGWVRASGYDLGDFNPTRHDLDRTGLHRPVRLVHRSGHLAVVNSAGLAAMPESVLAAGRENGLLDLDDDGEPSGLLWEPGEWFSNAVLPPLSDDEIVAGLRQTEDVLLSHGIVAVHDASSTNNRARYDLWRRLRPRFRLLVLPGERHLSGFQGAEEDEWIRLGPVKVVLPDMESEIPDEAVFVRRALVLQRPIAVHAVIHRAVRLAVNASRHIALRIEHGAEWPDDLLENSAGITAVMHPGWVRERATRYLETVPPEVLPWLHRGASLVNAGVRVWFGSDYPASNIDPWGAIATAVTRRAADGTQFNLSEAMSIQAAITASTGGNVVFDYATSHRPLTRGSWADFQVLPEDPFYASNLAGVRPSAVYLAGTLAWAS